MIDFTLEAEKLMAETAPASKGGLGIPLAQWRKEYGDSQCYREQRDFIAGFLKRLIRRAQAEEKKGRKRPC